MLVPWRFRALLARICVVVLSVAPVAVAAPCAHAAAAPPRSAAARALAFFRPDPTNHGYGHVGISLGAGRMISALARVTVTRVAGSRYWSALYAGWAPVPRSWLVPDSWSSSQRLTSSP